MSVKKSLWIGLALAAAALLIVGCSTEDSDSDGGGSFSYQKSALWEAASAARTNLVATKVSDQAGNDIGTSDKWVSPVQYNAFNKAITDAEAAAEALGRSALAIEPTPAEQADLDKLLANQAKFDSYKASGLAVEVTALTFSANLAVPAIVKQDIEITAASAISSILTIENAKLALNSTGTPTVTGTVNVKEGGKLVLNPTTAGTFASGQMTLYSGSQFIDEKEGANLPSLPLSSTGTTVVHAGAVVKNTPSANQPVVLIGPDKGDNKGQVYQLTAGTLTMAVTGYTLNGDATLVGEFTSVASSVTAVVKLTETSTLTIANKGNLISSTNVDFLAGSENGAKIVIATGGSITVPGDFSSSTPNMPTDAWTTKNETKAVIAGPVTLIYNAGTSKWVKQ
jgi:hypothetical protein